MLYLLYVHINKMFSWWVHKKLLAETDCATVHKELVHKILNRHRHSPFLLSSFRRAGWAGRGRGWWLVKLLPFQGKMRSPLHFTARRRKRKSISAKSSSTSLSAFAYSVWSGSFMPSTCDPPWPNGWWPYTRHLLSWMPIAAVPKFPRRGSGAHTDLRSTLAWKPEVRSRFWQVCWHIQSQPEAAKHMCGGMVKEKIDMNMFFFWYTVLCRWAITCDFIRIWVWLDNTDRIKIPQYLDI